MDKVNLIFTLLVAYQLKHLLCDYVFQSSLYFLGKFKTGWGWIVPLAVHCAIHAVGTFTIVMFVRPEYALSLALFDFTCHFLMDRVKASPNMLGRFKALNGQGMMEIFKNIPIESIRNYTRLAYKDTWWAKQLISNKYFWISLGIDQMIHGLTHYTIIYWLVS